MKNAKLRPLDDRVVVEPMRGRGEDRRRHRAAGHRQGKAAARQGRLRSAPASCSIAASAASSSVAVGDEVLFGKYAGTEIEVDGEEVKILRESDILAKVVS